MAYDIATLAARIKAVPFRHWEQLALDAKCTRSLPRKIVYEQERNFGVHTLKPLFDHFERIDRGEASLPTDRVRKTADKATA